MIIGIDASRAARKKKTGTEVYSEKIIFHLAKTDTENQYFLYTNKDFSSHFKSKLPGNFKIKILKCPFLWTQFRLSLDMLFKPPDILFVPAHAIPIIHPRRVVVTIHDLGFLRYPDNYSRLSLLNLVLTTRQALSWASKIITVSNFTKKDLLQKFKADPEKIEVVHHGFDLAEWQKAINAGKRKFDFPYMLFCGRLETRKNLIRMFKAFELLKIRDGIPHKFIFAGGRGVGFNAFRNTVIRSKYRKDVRFLGHVQDSDLPSIYASADFLAFATLFEGFGFPILEAFASGIPVVTSNVSSMPEVAGDCAVLVSPNDVESVYKGFKKILFDANFKADLIRKGRERVKKFNWDAAAAETKRILTSR